MPFSYQDFMADLQPPGTYTRELPNFDPPTLTPLRRPIAQSTIGVFTSCGARLASDPALATTNDLSYRLLPRDVPLAELVFDHETPVRGWAEQDLNVAYPRDRLLELEQDGTIGRLADRAVSMVGSITRFTELTTATVPRIKDEFEQQGVDLVLLFPF
jgi:D-proline reductase (dithiol) PrdB